MVVEQQEQEVMGPEVIGILLKVQKVHGQNPS